MDIWQFLEMSLVVTSQGMLLSSKAKDAAKHAIMHWEASCSPPTKHYPAQYVSGVEVKKACSIGIIGFILLVPMYTKRADQEK